MERENPLVQKDARNAIRKGGIVPFPDGEHKMVLLDELVVELERTLLRLERNHFYERARVEFRFLIQDYKEYLNQKGIKPIAIETKVQEYKRRYESLTGDFR